MQRPIYISHLASVPRFAGCHCMLPLQERYIPNLSHGATERYQIYGKQYWYLSGILQETSCLLSVATGNSFSVDSFSFELSLSVSRLLWDAGSRFGSANFFFHTHAHSFGMSSLSHLPPLPTQTCDERYAHTSTHSLNFGWLLDC